MRGLGEGRRMREEFTLDVRELSLGVQALRANQGSILRHFEGLAEEEMQIPSGTTTPAPTATKEVICDSGGCFNIYPCCPVWASTGECKKNGRCAKFACKFLAAWMACNCKVSCGICAPVDYTYGCEPRDFIQSFCSLRRLQQGLCRLGEQ